MNVSVKTNIHDKFLQLICMESEFMERLIEWSPRMEEKLKKIKFEIKSKNLG